MNKKTNDILRKWSGPAVSMISYGVIIGFALSGLGIMGMSALMWLLFSTSLFSGFGLLTGGLFLCAATAMFLSKLGKASEMLHGKSEKQQAAKA
jgi:hypothetical protein